MADADGVVVRVLGPFSVTAGGRAAGPWPRPSARRLCELVLVSPGRRVSRDVAREELFPGLDPHAASRALSKALSMARATLAGLGEPAASLLTADLTHIWAAPGAVVDAAAQEGALRAALALDPGGGRDDALVAALADEAELLADEPYADWAAGPRERLESLRQRARLTLARDRSAGAGAADPDSVTAAWLAAFEHDPASEEAAAALLRCYSRPGGGPGHRELAARAYERHAAALSELGLGTSPAVASRYAAVTREAAADAGSAADSAGGPDSAGGSGLAGGFRSSDGPSRAGPAREELRTVTVLAAEVGTAITAAGDPESLREVVGGVLAAVIAEVEALGGQVTSVSGHGLQAMFGAPRAHEDDPERAVRAAYRGLAAVSGNEREPALAGQDGGARPALPAVPAGLSGLAGRSGPASPETGAAWLRIGVETGPALVGPIGAGRKVEYGAVGEVVSVAASLQSLAAPGAALVGPATRAAVEHLFSWGARVPVTGADGGAGPDAGTGGAPSVTPTASVLGEPLALGHPPLLTSRGPLVGRAAELAVLDAALRDAVRGRGSVLVLRGEPGLGKTRLVQETRRRFLAWAGASEGRLPLWLEGRAASYASATPYGVYQQLLAGWLGVAPDQPRQLVRAALERALSALLASTELLPLLEHVMGLSPDAAGPDGPAGRPGRPDRLDGLDRLDRLAPEELREAAFGALRTVISRLTPARRPAVIVLEDLHWADPTSLRFTRELIPLATRRPLLILATTRPDAAVNGKPDGTGGAAADAGAELRGLLAAAAVRTVDLRPLPDAASRELAVALVGGRAGAEVIDAALAGTDGNPLFLEERVSALLETGSLTLEQGTWWLNGTTAPPVPQLLDRLVRSRIDRLGPAAREVIRLGSVLGTEFPLSLIAAVCRRELPGLGEPGLEAALDELCARDLLRQAPGSAEAAFRFRHALIQEATYGGLLRADRRRLHGRAAAALEHSCATCLDEVAAVLGRHFAAAGEREQALHYLELAADNATWAFANDEAVTAYTEALGVAAEAGDPDAGARLCAKLANVLWRTARRDETRAAFTEALRLADALPDPDPLRRAHLMTRLGRLEMADGRHAAAARAFDAAEALLGPPPTGSAAAAGVGEGIRSGAGAASRVPGAASGEGGDRDETDLWLELTIDGRADLALQAGDFEAAAAVLESARPVLEARGNATRRYGFYEALAMLRVERAGLRADDEAVADMRRALAAAEASRDVKDTGYATYFLGWILWLRGDKAEAGARFRAALEIAERVGEALLLSSCLGSLALVALSGHDVAAVRDLAPRAVAAAAPVGGSQVAWATAPLAWVAWQDGRRDDVRAIAAEVDGEAADPGFKRTMYRWVYLLPLIAVSLDAGDTAAAVAAARRLLDPGQALLPQALNEAVESACRSWDTAAPAQAAERLAAALSLARALGFC